MFINFIIKNYKNNCNYQKKKYSKKKKYLKKKRLLNKFINKDFMRFILSKKKIYINKNLVKFIKKRRSFTKRIFYLVCVKHNRRQKIYNCFTKENFKIYKFLIFINWKKIYFKKNKCTFFSIYILYLKKSLKKNLYIKKNYAYLKKNIHLKKKIKLKKKIRILSNENYFSVNKKEKNNPFFFKINLKRRNLFINLLNPAGSTVDHISLGYYGYKGKKKFTGFSVENSAKFFSKKTYKKVTKLLHKYYKDITFNNSFFNIMKKKKDKNLKKARKSSKKLKKKILFKKKLLFTLKKKLNYLKENTFKLTKLFQLLLLNNFFNYLKLTKFKVKKKNLISKHFIVGIWINAELNQWCFRFLFKGFFESQWWFGQFRKRVLIAHHTGHRLKKKRRL